MQLLCIGDIALSQKTLPQSLWMPPGGIIPADGTRILFNWELPIGRGVNPVPRRRGRRILAHPHSPHIIRTWSPGFATLATNHILDAGEEGLVETIETFSQMNFATVGAGRTREEITRPAVWETSEGRLGIVNWVFPETHPDWMSIPGPNCWPGLEEAKNTIHQLKRQTDWVLVVVHWSDELFPYPRPEDRVLARQLERMGADFIVGHHPHVVRGMEIIESCPVFYSIGNFFFSNIQNREGRWIVRQAPRNCEGLGIEIIFRRERKPDYRILSFWRKREEAAPDSLGRAARRMERVSRPLRQLPISKYREWYAIQRARFDRWGYRWHFGLWQLSKSDVVRFSRRMLSSCLGE